MAQVKKVLPFFLLVFAAGVWAEPAVKVLWPSAGTIDFSLRSMPWCLDEPLELVGMRGYPKSGAGTSYDLRRFYSFHIFFNRPTAPGGFSVSRISIREGGDRAKTLSAADFLPFVDRYGQFAHDTWRGRGDGENNQVGFLTVADTPYPELVRAARGVAHKMYLRRKTGQIERQLD